MVQIFNFKMASFLKNVLVYYIMFLITSIFCIFYPGRQQELILWLTSGEFTPGDFLRVEKTPGRNAFLFLCVYYWGNCFRLQDVNAVKLTLWKHFDLIKAAPWHSFWERTKAETLAVSFIWTASSTTQDTIRNAPSQINCREKEGNTWQKRASTRRKFNVKTKSKNETIH